MTVIDVRAELIAYYQRRGYARTGVHKPFPYGDERFGEPKRADLRFEVLEKVLRTGGMKARQELKSELLSINKWKGRALAKDGDGRTVAEVEKEAAARERAACLLIVEAPHWKQIVSNEMKRRAGVIRARG